MWWRICVLGTQYKSDKIHRTVHPELQLNVYPSSEELICIRSVLNISFQLSHELPLAIWNLKVIEIDYGICKNENGNSMNMGRRDEKCTCTHFSHMWRKKQNGEKKNILKPYTNTQGIFLVIDDWSCSSNVENDLWTSLKKDGSWVKGWETEMYGLHLFKWHF